MKTINITYYKKWYNNRIPSIVVVEANGHIDMVGVFYISASKLNSMIRYGRALEEKGDIMNIKYNNVYISRSDIEDIITDYKADGARIRRKPETFKADIEQENLL